MNVARKLAAVAVLVCAINFLLIAGGAAFLFGTGALSKEKLAEMAKVAYPEPPPPATQPAGAGADAAHPLLKFDELLSATTGKTAAEQLQYVRAAFDQQMALLSRQRQELLDLKRQVELARAQVIDERAKLDVREKTIASREEALNKKVIDKGLADALKLYNGLPTKQVKDLFATLDDETVVRYLQAMDSRRASRILSEFKTPEELSRAQALLERMRKNGLAAPTPEATRGATPRPTAASANPGASAATPNAGR